MGGSDYGGVRVGTFIGLRIISQLAPEAPGGSSGGGGGGGGGGGEVPPIGAPPLRVNPGRCCSIQASWLARQPASLLKHTTGATTDILQPWNQLFAGGGYLANVQPSEFSRRYEHQLPESLPGVAFLQQYGSHWDSATTIDAAQVRRRGCGCCCRCFAQWIDPSAWQQPDPISIAMFITAS